VRDRPPSTMLRRIHRVYVWSRWRGKVKLTVPRAAEQKFADWPPNHILYAKGVEVPR
jgi:hypothetical protein